MRQGFKNKKVVISDITSLTGSIFAVAWLLGQGARVTIMGNGNVAARDALREKIEKHMQKIARDGRDYDQRHAQLVWSPTTGVPSDADFVVTDETALFLAAWHKKVIGITGVHGKTTAALWAAHLIGDAVVAGHVPERPLMAAVASRARVAVIELSVQSAYVASHLSVVSTDDAPTYHLPGFSAQWGSHHEQNLSAAVHAARLAGIPLTRIQTRIRTLPQISGQQEIIYHNRRGTIVNDTAAVSPEAGVVALERFGGPSCILIAGGTDEQLDVRAWARTVRERIHKTNIVFLQGTATKKMRVALGVWGRGIRAYDTLAEACAAARERAASYVSSVILFSPASKSFGLFQNAYDRGKQFNTLMRE